MVNNENITLESKCLHRDLHAFVSKVLTEGSQGARVGDQGAARGPKVGPISSSPLRAPNWPRSSMVPPDSTGLGCPWVY